LNNSKLDGPKQSGMPSEEQLRSIPVDANRIDSRDLFVGTRELIIGHGSETYRLRLTAQNKLILTK
jgi:hemin uptake protein HemP